MKRSILLLTIITVCYIYSCTSPHTKIKPENSNSSGFTNLDTTVPFEGFWLSKEYVNKIKETKSPIQSQNENVHCIEIPDSTLQITRMVSGLHEGAADMVVVKKGKSFQLYYKYDDTIRNLAYDIQVLSKNEIKIGREIFVKSNHQFLEEYLFNGRYLYKQDSTIEFRANGEIKGLDSVKFYDPVYDYTTDESEVDEIYLGQNKNDMKKFGFRFVGDSLLIYQLECIKYDSINMTCVIDDLGNLVYRLRKLK